MWRSFCGGESQQSLLMLEGNRRSSNGTKVGLSIAAVEEPKNGFATVLAPFHGEESTMPHLPLCPGTIARARQAKGGKIPRSAAALDDACPLMVYNPARVPSPFGPSVSFVALGSICASADSRRSSSKIGVGAVRKRRRGVAWPSYTQIDSSRITASI